MFDICDPSMIRLYDLLKQTQNIPGIMEVLIAGRTSWNYRQEDTIQMEEKPSGRYWIVSLVAFHWVLTQVQSIVIDLILSSLV